MKRTLGLDLGTNSIGWAVVGETDTKKEILGLGSRIIPMSQDILGNFNRGVSVSQTANRTGYRGSRRLRERHLLRRERLHRVLNILGFLPEHYAKSIDFERRLGKFHEESEPKLAWKKNNQNSFEFIFNSSFLEMVYEFKSKRPDLFTLNEKGIERKIPYDWTIYYLRKKALSYKIEKEEIAWLILNFNQKRGYYQLREEEDEEKSNKLVEFHSLKVIDVTADEPQKGKPDIWYNMILENGWVYRRSSKTPLYNWKDNTKDFIVTTDLNDDGTIKTDKEGIEKRSFRAPSDGDWTLIKKKTEFDIDNSEKFVGCYIYDTLLQNPLQKINGKLVRTIERKYYKEELKAILDKQKEYHPELQSSDLYIACLKELYQNNEPHRNNLLNKGFTHLFLNDIIFYQRPLKSKKSLISNCNFEYHTYKDPITGEQKKDYLKCIAKSHPLFQELRIWKFVKDLRIYEREKTVDGQLKMDIDVTSEFVKTEEDLVLLFDWLNDRKEIKQEVLLSSYFKVKKRRGEEKLPYRWNYVEDKVYPCNETYAQIFNRLSKVNSAPEGFLTKETELALWHILYSIDDKIEIEKALNSFALKNSLGSDFVDAFIKFPPFPKEYGSYSAKATKKLLSIMRCGKYWVPGQIDSNTMKRIDKILTGEFDDNIGDRVREKAIQLKEVSHFKGLPEWLARYVVYDRHSESNDLSKWETPQDIEWFLNPKNSDGFNQHSLRNPIVEQVITETLRTIKDIWEQYGSFAEIHIELGREMKNPANKRKDISEQILLNENTNLRIKALLAELANHKDIENVRPFSPNQQEILKIYEEGVLNSRIEIPEEIIKISKTSQPTKSDLIKYKLWLEQKYRSPYTGEMIPLAKLFTPAYEIEHIIPQARYFDDSLSNKIICEAEVNHEKRNLLGYEFIRENEGKIIELSFNKSTKIFSIQEYENFVKEHYAKSRGKMKKLLMAEIPDDFIERQLNDSRYISKVVKGLLSNIVREDEEIDAISKNVITCTGSITSTLKNDWGLNDVWNRILTPRFERMNNLTNSNLFGNWKNQDGKRIFQTSMPLDLQKGFQKKRIDHRHHAMDALVIACATRSHVNYLNNESAKKSSKESRYDLKTKLCFKNKTDDNGNYSWQFYKPWDSFTQDTQAALENIVVSFKQNLRVINKSTNKYEHYDNGKKVLSSQIKGDNWAIRKPMHKETFAGIVNIRLKRTVSLSLAIDHWETLVNKSLKTKIKQLINEGLEKNKILKFFVNQDYKWMGKDISKVELYYFSSDKESDVLVASRVCLDETFDSKKIDSITDTGISLILINHLNKYNDNIDGKTIERPDLAFSPEGIEEMNKNIHSLNNNKFHKPIRKVRTFEPKGNKFNVGIRGNKKDKFVEAASGTNLYFAIYEDNNGKRNYQTIPLNIVIERLKNGINPVAELINTDINNSHTLKFYLNPNDLVYIPTVDQIENNYPLSPDDIDRSRIYRFVDSSGTTANFVPASVATTILDMNKKEQQKAGLNFPIQNEIGIGSAQSKNQKATTGEMIKEICIKLKIDRLGNVLLIG